MQRSSEVRVRRVVSRLLVGVVGLGFGLGLGISAAAQTTAAQTTSPQSANAQTVPANAPAAQPVPSAEGQEKIESMPGYRQQHQTAPQTSQQANPQTTPQINPQAIPQTAPIPQHAPAPVVTPAQPTAQVPYTALPAYGNAETGQPRDTDGSAYIPVDSWVYPAMLRLYSLGYVDTAYLAMRPYTRRSALHMLEASEGEIVASGDEQAQEILSALLTELTDEGVAGKTERGTVYGLQSVYTRMMGISGPILVDSYHVGQTFFNDYGRPHETGFNNITGFSTLNEQGPFSLYVRGEYQHAPSAAGYSQALAQQISLMDEIVFAPPNDPEATVPAGPIAAQNPFRLVEATLSVHLLGHEISGGKSDAWLGPGMGSAMPWSNNAENIYSFRINRVEPLYVKYLSKYLGPVRYDFFYGSLKGHTDPNDDWVHSDMFSFQPTANFQFGFQRTVIFGGKGHEPVTIRTFLKGFFDTNDTSGAEKSSRDDPGARFSAFHFSYRLPFVRNYLTLYTDSEVHDDLTPVSAPRRAGYRPGIYLAQFPGLKRLDLRVEGVSTDCSTLVCLGGSNEYVENAIQKQGYTNKGNILGDWIGREAKGGQAWLTWHLSGNEWVQVEYLNKKSAKDFIPGGTSQGQFRVDVVKRIGPQVEVNGWFQHERWSAPVYLPGVQNNNTVTVQVTFFPKLKTKAP